MSIILQRLADTDERFDEYSDETCPLRPGELGEEHHDGHWLYTAPGWINPASETHAIHAWTVKHVLSEVKGIVPCRCDDCLETLGYKGAVIRTSDRQLPLIPLACEHAAEWVVTCGICDAHWCEKCDPGPAALCHTCHGRGYSLAPRINP